MSFKVKKLYMFLGLTGIIFLLSNWHYLATIFRVTVTPEKANTKFEYGRYSSWAWTPDGQVIYVKSLEQMEQTKGMGTMGYRNLGTVTQIRVINPDGTGDKLIKEIFYQSVRQKLVRRYHELKEQHNGRMLPEYYDQANKESSNGTLDMHYPDAPLAHIGWIDWNKVNNKLVFVANDGTGKMRIAISDPEFKEVRWIICEGNRAKWSPDGNKIASIKNALVSKNGNSWYIAAGDIWIIDELSKEKQTTNGYNFDSLCWLPDGKRILVHNENENYRGMGIVDISTGKMEKLGDGISPSISPDGQKVVYFDVDIKIMDINGKNINVVYPKGGSSFPKWSPDGKKILMGWEGQIEIINTDGSGYFEITKGLQDK